MKKITKFTLAIAALALAGTATFAKPKKQKVIKIGAIQLVEHPALDASYKGFVDGLKAAGYEDGKNIKLMYENAQGEQSNCVTIADKFISQRCDIIFAIATPAAQAVANKTETTPILVTAVTDPKTAGLVESNEKPGTNVTGTSDLTPCAAQIQLLKKLLPNTKKVAMLYCSSEENSRFQINLAKAECDRQGLTYVDATVSNTNEVQQVVQSLVGKVDAIYVPTDNMLAAGMANVVMVANQAKIPTIVGEDGMVQSGGLCTYGVNYYELGKQTGAMAVEILKNGANPADMPIQYLEKCDFSKNANTEKALGLTLPENL